MSVNEEEIAALQKTREQLLHDVKIFRRHLEFIRDHMNYGNCPCCRQKLPSRSEREEDLKKFEDLVTRTEELLVENRSALDLALKPVRDEMLAESEAIAKACRDMLESRRPEFAELLRKARSGEKIILPENFSLIDKKAWNLAFEHYCCEIKSREQWESFECFYFEIPE